MTYLLEHWKPVVGFEDIYEVSNLGTIRRIKQTARGTRKWYVLTPSVNADGYPKVGLCKNGKQRTMTVHKIVAGAFLGERPPGMEVNHKDLNRRNARISNLEYVTPSQNVRHMFANNKTVTRKGSHNGRAILQESDVKMIRAAGKSVSNEEWGRRFNMSPVSIKQARSGLKWSHVT